MAQKNMSLNKCPMPSLDPNYRNKVFEEVATGYTYEMAIEEARRCLNCKNKPCVSACPVRIDIPAFIEKLANEDIEGAFEILNKQSSLPAVCGRVCPQLTVGGETKFACVDGPEFDGHLVDFDEAMSRGAMYGEFEAHKREETCNLLKKEVE